MIDVPQTPLLDIITNRTLIGLSGLIFTDVSGTAMSIPQRIHDRGAGPEFIVKSVHISPISPISVLFPIMPILISSPCSSRNRTK